MDDRTVDLIIDMIKSNKEDADNQYEHLDSKLDLVVERVNKQANWQNKIIGGLSLASFLFVAIFEGVKVLGH